MSTICLMNVTISMLLTGIPSCLLESYFVGETQKNLFMILWIKAKREQLKLSCLST